MRRVRGASRVTLLIVLLVAGVLAMTGVAPAFGAPPEARAGSGWSTGPGGELVWTAPEALPLGDAGVQFFAGDELLGTARPGRDGRTFRLERPEGRLDPATLEVRAGGRRLDAQPSAARRRAATPQVPVRGPASAFDPGTPGKFATTSGDYELPTVGLPGLPEPVEMVGHVVGPKSAPGARPLVLFLHGRHNYCYGGEDEWTWPCAAGSKPVPSQLGYLKAQQLLASQGYVTVSIAANGINGQDGDVEDGGAQARSSLIRRHLGRWADWAGTGRAQAPAVVRSVPRADLGRTLLVGHSRGGDGVNRAAMDSLVPPPADLEGYPGKVRWQIRGTFQLAPTIFGHNPVAEVPSVVLLPNCDGDVADLQGQTTVDGTAGVGRGAALHSALYVVGANHNYFNSEWTPGLSAAESFDDWYDTADPVCGEGAGNLRLAPEDQQQVGATYVAATAAAFLAGDERALPLLDGSGRRAPSAGPALVATHALGAGRTLLAAPEEGATVTGSGGVAARVCAEAPAYEAEGEACLPGDSWLTSPHFVRFSAVPSEESRRSALLEWTGKGQARIRAPRPVSLTGAQALTMRVALPSNSPTARFGVQLADARGRTLDLGPAALTGLPSSTDTGVWGQELRLALPKAKGRFDPAHVVEVRLSPSGGAGRAWVLDASGWSPGLRDAPARVTRVDVGDLPPVEEGDGGTTTTVTVPVRAAGALTGSRVRLWVSTLQGTTEKVVTLRPGQRAADVKLTVGGDELYAPYGQGVGVVAQAERGAVVGDVSGYAAVLEDDPAPTITVTPVADRVTEGGALTWRVTLSAPMSGEYYGYAAFRLPVGAELSTLDLTEDWLVDHYLPPDQDELLSASWAYLAPVVPAGATGYDLTLPIRTDGLAEGEEHTLVAVEPVDWEAQAPIEVPGTVLDAP